MQSLPPHADTTCFCICRAVLCCHLCCAAGIVPIVASWFISPLMAALFCLLFFVVLRFAVLRRVNSTSIAFWVLPGLLVFTVWVNLFFILVCGGSGEAGGGGGWGEGRW
jgi:sodium-dependent phosphate transporter